MDRNTAKSRWAENARQGIIKAMADQKVTEDQLAKQVGCSQQTVSGWKTGYRQITLRWAERVAEALDLRCDDFLCAGENDAQEKA